MKLSKQQTFILTLLAQGYSNADIMKLTDLTINTVKSHTRIIYQKLEVSNVADAVTKARKMGMIEL